MTESILGGIKRDTGWSIVLGVLIIVLGIVAMMAPLVAGVVAVYIIAWSAIFGGVAQVVYAIRTHEGGHAFLEVMLGLSTSSRGLPPAGSYPRGPAGPDPAAWKFAGGVRNLRAGAGVSVPPVEAFGDGSCSMPSSQFSWAL